MFPFCVAKPALALVVLGAAATSDVLDGWYARRFHEQTRTGALLDGIMDKVFVLTVLGTLVAARSIGLVQVMLLGTRELGELLLIATALVLRPRPLGSHRSASFLGKLATVLQFATVVLVIVHAPYLGVAVVVTAACGALAAAEYWREEWAANGG